MIYTMILMTFQSQQDDPILHLPASHRLNPAMSVSQVFSLSWILCPQMPQNGSEGR